MFCPCLRIVTACLGLLIVSANSQAHVSQLCLRLVEQYAEDLKRCVVKKQRENCRYDRQILSDQVEVCRKQQFDDEDVVRAIRMGESQVEGSSGYYIEPSASEAMNTATMVAKGNIENFSSQFPNIKAFPTEDLDAGANLGGCRRAFLAKGERYNFLGALKLRRYDSEDLGEGIPHTLFYFNRMVDGVCYSAPTAGQRMANGDLAIVNLPVSFFSYLKRAVELKGSKAVIIRCATKQTCDSQKMKTLEAQVDYQATYLRLKRLGKCQEASGAKGFIRRMIRSSSKESDLPTYCMEENLEKNIKSLHQTLDEISKQLFDEKEAP